MQRCNVFFVLVAIAAHAASPTGGSDQGGERDDDATAQSGKYFGPRGTCSHVLLSPASVPGVPMGQQILGKIHACPCMFICARRICAWRASCTRVQSHVRLRTRCASMFMQTWMRACMRALTCRCVHTESCSERQAIHVRLCNLRGQTCGYVLDYVQPFFGVCK